MQTSSDTKSITHWTKRQDIQYHFYVILKYPWIIQEDSPQSSVFKDMHRFIPTRSPAQCRSHHQKRTRGHPDLSSALAFFYREHYTERLLDTDHLRKQLRYFILQTYERQRIQQQERDQLFQSIEVNLELLDFLKKNLAGQEKQKINEQHQGNEYKQLREQTKQTAIITRSKQTVKAQRRVQKNECENVYNYGRNSKPSSKHDAQEQAVYDEDNDQFWLP